MQARSTEVVSVGVELKVPTETFFFFFFTVYKRCSVSADPKVRSSLVPFGVSHRFFSVASAGHVTALSPVEKKKKEKTVTQESNQNHPIFISQVTVSFSSEPAKRSDNISPTIVCLRTAGDHNDLSLEVEVKRSSHDEQHASASWKSNDLFYFPFVYV